jgi:predicted Zn-dependent protease
MSNGYEQRGIRIRWLPLVLGLFGILFVMARGCQEGPFGRHQVVGLSPEQEMQLGEQSYQKILEKEQVVREGKAYDGVQRVGRRLAAAATSEEFLSAVQLHPQKFVWEFQLVKSDQVNAFCLPGGKVVVYTGLLPVAKNEAGLATVLGHEIGHALAHHGAERIAQQELVQIGQVAASQSIDNLSSGQRQELMALLGAGSQVGVLLPFSRKHESEADHIGLLLMSAAGYNPDQAIDFWQRMEEQAKTSKSEFLSTHPSHEHRIHDIRGWLPDAEEVYQKKKEPNRSKAQ